MTSSTNESMSMPTILFSQSQRQGELNGIIRKFGQTLPAIDRVLGRVYVSEIKDKQIKGKLISVQSSIELRFTEKDLPSEFDQLKKIFLSVTNSQGFLSMRVSGQPFVERDSRIILYVRSFELSPHVAESR